MATVKSRRRPLVVGSGPAGVACAAALAARGLRPIVVDGGERLPSELSAVVAGLARTDPGEWDAASVARFRDAFSVDVDRLPLKPSFGSLFPYDEKGLSAEGVGAVPSLAAGGLSTVWGAAVLPYGEREHSDWPFGPAELAPHYQAVLGFMPLSAEDDALAADFPLYAESVEPLRVTRQVRALLDRLRLAGPSLRRAGVTAGRSRLAVHASSCRYTGFCMIGCPYGAIYDSSATLRALAAAGEVEYRAGAVVRRFEEGSDSVRVTFAGEVAEFDRLFLAGGSLATPRLVLSSLGLHDVVLPLLDSCYFTAPLLGGIRTRAADPADPGNTLAQLFLELDDPAVSPHRVHLQVYAYNDLMLRAVAARAHLPERLTARVLGPAVTRLLYLQGYLHSDESGRGTLQLVRDGSGERLVAAAAPNGDDLPRRVLSRLATLRRDLGFGPVPRMLQVWPVGKGFHHGGSMPMRQHPSALETDLLGRPAGLARVHVVDATVLPTIPAQTITLPVMANAHRIATEA